MIADQIAVPESSFSNAEPWQAGSATNALVSDLEQQARAFVRRRPVMAVLAAAGIGYVVARFVSRVLR